MLLNKILHFNSTTAGSLRTGNKILLLDYYYFMSITQDNLR